MDERARHVTAAATLVLATPVSVWWAVGDVSSKGFDDLDYMVRPIELPPVVEAVVGGLAVVLVVVCAAVLGHALYRGRVRREWSATVLPLCAAGAVVGAGWGWSPAAASAPTSVAAWSCCSAAPWSSP